MTCFLKYRCDTLLAKLFAFFVSGVNHKRKCIDLQGGRHVDYVADQITSKLIDTIKKKIGKSGISVKPFQVSFFLFVCLFVCFFTHCANHVSSIEPIFVCFFRFFFSSFSA